MAHYESVRGKQSIMVELDCRVPQGSTSGPPELLDCDTLLGSLFPELLHVIVGKKHNIKSYL